MTEFNGNFFLYSVTRKEHNYFVPPKHVRIKRKANTQINVVNAYHA